MNTDLDDKIKAAVLGCAIGVIVLVILMFMGMSLYGWQSPPGVNEFLTGIGAGAMSIFTMIAGFYFGSSRGSQKKDETIAALTKPTEQP